MNPGEVWALLTIVITIVAGALCVALAIITYPGRNDL